MSLLFQNVIRLNKMSLLRGFYVSIYCRSTNLKNIWNNPCKIDVRFVKKQPLKKSAPTIFFKKCFCLMKVFVFSVPTSKDTETYNLKYLRR